MTAVADPVGAPAPAEATPPVSAAPGDERISVASQRQLMWWRFRRHRVAMASAMVIALFYVVVVFADFFAYADPFAADAQRTLLPPQPIHLFDEGRFSPYVHPVTGVRDFTTFQRVYREDTTRKFHLQLFARGHEYKLFGFLPANVHLFGLAGNPVEGNLFILGADLQGRDLWSRLMYSTQTSLTIGLVGVTVMDAVVPDPPQLWGEAEDAAAEVQDHVLKAA